MTGFVERSQFIDSQSWRATADYFRPAPIAVFRNVRAKATFPEFITYLLLIAQTYGRQLSTVAAFCPNDRNVSDARRQLSV